MTDGTRKKIPTAGTWTQDHQISRSSDLCILLLNSSNYFCIFHFCVCVCVWSDKRSFSNNRFCLNPICRLSFPSGHSSFSMYCMLYLIVSEFSFCVFHWTVWQHEIYLNTDCWFLIPDMFYVNCSVSLVPSISVMMDDVGFSIVSLDYVEG